MRPQIVVVGSGDTRRNYSPPLTHAEQVADAGEAIGAALARAGCDLVVFSSSDNYVEKDVVRGFLTRARRGDQRRVKVRTPHDKPVQFDVSPEAAELVQVEPDPATDWEASYYQTLLQADGVVVIGGGRSTRIAGVIAIARRTPIAAVAAFGGGALTVWQHLCKHRNDASPEDLFLMGRPWAADAPDLLVASLLAQRNRQRAAARRAASRISASPAVNSALAVGALVLAAATVGLAFTTTNNGIVISCLLGGPMLTAIGGALLRETRPEDTDAFWPIARGLGAGLLVTMLYVASQLLTNDKALTVDSARRLLWFVIPIGLAAGYTFDLVYARLRRADVLPGRLLELPAARTPADSSDATS